MMIGGDSQRQIPERGFSRLHGYGENSHTALLLCASHRAPRRYHHSGDSWSWASRSEDRSEEELGRDFHIFLPLYHLPNYRFVIKSFLTARLTALKQTVIALRVEQALFIKASFLKAVVNVCGNNEIILVLHQLQKVLIIITVGNYNEKVI